MKIPAETEEAATVSRDDTWQRTLLPLMVRVIVVLAVAFFVISLGQLTYLHWRLAQKQESRIPGSITKLVDADGEARGNEEGAQLAFAALLESEAMIRRYELASVILMAHIWIRYLGFVTGMAMAIIGAVFILGKLRDPSVSEFGAEARGVKLSLTSASPGLVLTGLGAVLMIVTVLAQQETKVTDTPLYAPFSRSAPPNEGPAQGADFFRKPLPGN